MAMCFGRYLGLAAVLMCVVPAIAQDKPASPQAAVVNGQVIPELAVQRALKPIPAEHHTQARPEILQFLIDQTLVDQYLARMQVPAPKEEVEARVKKVKDEAKAKGHDFEKLLGQLMLTEDELRQQLEADLRWENYVKQQANDQVLAEFFKGNKDWFDGSQVRARHILVAVAADAPPQAREAARSKLADIRKQLDARVADALSKVDPKADALIREQARVQALTGAFGELAEKGSDCPSKKNGGDLGWFPRIGSMVEPFAKAAFSLQAGQMVSPVETQFGYHAILVVGRLPGKEVKFDDVKDEVREVYSDRLREAMLPQLRQTARVEVKQPVKQ